MLRMLEKKPGTAVGLNLASTYEDALDNTNLLKTVGILFLVGFSVFGSFTYAGKFVETMTGYNILSVGLILTFFGLATVLGGQITGSLKQKIGIKILLLAGILGCVSWSVMWAWHFAVLMALSLFGFGLAFIIIQPIVVTAAQQIMPKQRGTVMSLASFNMFVGGGLGTLLNGYILRIWGFAPVFICASALILVSGLIATYVLRGQVAG
jgi:predicted MFS family arabinose efflux permease